MAIRQIAGVLTRPRTTLAELVTRPAWAATWSTLLLIWALCGGWLLSTDVGQQALVDEQVRVIETLGGEVTDDEYAALQARPPVWVYFTSGGRLLLTPGVTLLAAAALWLTARYEGAKTTYRQALAVVVHASVVLLVGQLIATPFHYVRETLSAPLNLGALLPLDHGTLPARFFGMLDLFALWWAALLALGASVMTGRRWSRYAWPLAGIVVVFAALVAVIVAAMEGA